MASPKYDAYMASHREGDTEEDRRLDVQHEMVKYGIGHGKILHPLIPSHDIKTVADVATGTGVWMNDFVRTFGNDPNSSSLSLVGFDITDKRFTKNPEPGVEFVVHNATEPFAPSYHGKFDLVNVRLVNYAIPRQNFPSLVENVAQLLRPGGYLQWQESDTWDMYPVPQSAVFTRALEKINAERDARGLVTYLPPFLTKSLLSLQIPPDAKRLPKGHPSTDLFRILSLESLPTGAADGAPDDVPEDIATQFQSMLVDAIELLLQGRSLRVKGLAAEEKDEAKKANLLKDAAENDQLVKSTRQLFNTGQVKMAARWMWLVAEKAHIEGQS